MKKKQSLYTAVLLAVFAVLALVYLLSGSGSSTLSTEVDAFAIKDTAAVEQVTLTEYRDEQATQSVTLARAGQTWLVDGQHEADPQKVRMLLQTLRDIQVREPVTEEGRKNVFGYMKVNHTRVAVETRSGEDRVYYIGTSTPDGKGTHTLMKGSDQPYITEMPGEIGHLKPRFASQASEWRSYTVLAAAPQAVREVAVRYPGVDSSFVLTRGDSGWALDGGQPVDSNMVRTYLQAFRTPVRAVGTLTETYPTRLDSLKKTRPALTLRVRTTQDTAAQVLHLVPNPASASTWQAWHPQGQELYLVQRFSLREYLPPRRVFVPAR